MANTTITNLPTVTALNGSEPLLGVQSSNSVQITTGQIASLASGNGGLPFSVSSGGTGKTTLTQYGLLYGNGTSPVDAVSPPSGTNYILVGSAGSAPTWQPTIPVTAGVDSVAFGTTGLTPVAATAGVVSVAFGTVPTAAGIYSPATNQIALSTNSTRQLLIDSTGAATFTTSVTSPLFLATASRTATATTGAYSYGTNGFSDTSVLLSLQSSVNNYNQTTIQNTSAGTSASAEFIAYNDGGTSSTNYAAVGINSSGYTGTGSLNAAGYGFFTTGSTDLVLGTIGSNAIHFVTNSSATDAMSISAAGAVSITTSLTTPLVIGGTTASSTLTLQSTSGVGTSDSVSIKVGNNGATTGLTVATTGIASFPTTGATGMVVGTTAQRPTAATGYFRFNSSLPRFEGYDGTSWTPFAITTGGGNDTIFTLNGQTVTTNYTVPATTNAMSSGPIVINTGITVTVTTGSQWNII